MGPGPEALTLISHVDWAAFARSLGARGLTVTRPEELAPAFTDALASSGPVLVDVYCDKTAETPITPWKQAAHEWEDDH
jgi:acetolactate synthase-1/2/3 large subunit